MSKPIVVYTHGGPNPWKVVMVLEELGIPYESKLMAHEDVKKEPYININPNGRAPTIEDPNTGITLWESGAILEYLVDTYDKENKLNITSFPEKYHLKFVYLGELFSPAGPLGSPIATEMASGEQQYLHFQMSGQGPYFGQTTWFRKFHGEQVDSAKKRYDEQLVRVVEVLDKILAGKHYLVGEKCTYADIAFVPWDNVISWILGDDAETLAPESKYPNFYAWHKRLVARPAIQAALQQQMKAQGR